MNLKAFIAVILLLTAVSAFADYNEDRMNETSSYLTDIKKRLKEEQKELEKIETTKKNIASKASNLSEILKNQSEIIGSLTAESEQLRKELRRLDREKGKLTEENNKLKDSIETSNIYLIDNIDYVNVKLLLFSPHSQNTIKNMEIVESINSVLMKRVEEISEKADRLEAIKEEKSSKSRDIEHMIRIKQNLSSEYDVEKQKLDQLLAVMNQDEESKNEYIKILADKQKDFEKKLDRIRAQIQEEAKKNDNKKDSRDTGEFGMLKGKMDWPVEGVITEFFGPKKVEGFRGTIQNKGIKIEPSKLGDVRAVYGGTVKYKDAIRGFGNLVIISHTDSYFTLYANMDRVNVETGQQVVKEQVIGTVTVDRLPETPYLYFEIRKHNEALNPSEWLRPNRR